MAQIETWLNQEMMQAVKVRYLDGNLFSMDNAGNLIGVTLTKNGTDYSGGGTVSANVIRADGGTVAVSGALSGNVATVVLPQAAYAVPGVVSIVVKLTANSEVTTIAAVVANVYESTTSTTIDPGTIIPSVQTLISQINTAVSSIPADYSSLWTSLAPAFSTSTAYAEGNYVTYSGGLYIFVKDHAAGSWSSSDVVPVRIGDELTYTNNKLAILDNKLFDSVAEEWLPSTNYQYGWRAGYFTGEIGETYGTSASNNYMRIQYAINTTNYDSAEDADIIVIKPPTGYAVKVLEADDTNKITAIFGFSINTESDPTGAGRTVMFPFNPARKYCVSLGKLDGDASTKIADESFCKSIKLYFAYSKAEKEINELTETVAGISANLDAIFYTEQLEFTTSDWRTGYYKSVDGAFKSSNHYICTANAYTISKTNATRLTVEAPEGYFVKVSEYTSGGTFVATYGDTITNKIVEVSFAEGNYFRLSIGRFDNNDAGDFITTEFISQIKVSIDEVKMPDYNTKLDRTGDFEWFTVTVDRPLAFGGEEVNDPQEAQEIECVLRLPTTYTKAGTPTRLILACHGSSGYIKSSTSTWYNSNWKTFMDALLSAGYAVFDANVLPTSTGTDQMGFAVGSPLYVNVLKKAYNYIVYNYNVYEKIFAHGTSMGGVGASAFTKAYPGIVLAESSFAGRDVTLYAYRIYNGTYAENDEFSAAWGYTDMDALAADKWSHIDGSAPSLSLLKYTDGVMQYPPDRATDYSNWLAYYQEIQTYNKNDPIGQYTAYRSVPYKAWDSWADDSKCTKAKLILQKAFTVGGSSPYEVVVYDNATHTELSYGQVTNMIDELVAWFKRWE